MRAGARATRAHDDHATPTTSASSARVAPGRPSPRSLACVSVAPYFAHRLLALRPRSTRGVSAIGAIGLNLLTGYTGQVTLGHAFFIGFGAYTPAYLGRRARAAAAGLARRGGARRRR